MRGFCKILISMKYRIDKDLVYRTPLVTRISAWSSALGQAPEKGKQIEYHYLKGCVGGVGVNLNGSI